jgi:hypothetical protein
VSSGFRWWSVPPTRAADEPTLINGVFFSLVSAVDDDDVMPEPQHGARPLESKDLMQ